MNDTSTDYQRSENAPTRPVVPHDGERGNTTSAEAQREAILSIKDPRKRRAAIRENIDLF